MPKASIGYANVGGEVLARRRSLMSDQLKYELAQELGFAHKVEGNGPNKNRQEGPHAHGVYFRGNHLLVPDLGLDKVLTYTLDPDTAKPTGGDAPADSSSAPGAGPRLRASTSDSRRSRQCCAGK